MKKGCLTSIYISLALLVALAIAFVWAIQSAFGPSYKTVNIDLGEGRTLIGEETYNADFAAVFYDVDLKLITQDSDTFKLGKGTFNDENWQAKLQLNTMGNWYVLTVKESSYSKLLMVNRTTKHSLDTVFSPLELRYDSLWKAIHDEVPLELYRGNSTIDSVNMNNFFVTFDYRIDHNKQFTSFVQSVEYMLDPVTGKIETRRVFDRKEKE